jgi:hypothetical protein
MNPNKPALVLYTAPTGTGKTLTPLGLSEQKKIIFVCVARHVGLALAKSAISVGKKTAFAYGCESAEDIRLHYFSAKEYTKNRKSGGIGKVDNSVGEKVQIIICDVKSYLIAMYYMLAFNDENNIITYWDEPTITMDYEHHDLHEIIQNNWANNKISKVVLSSATLPNIKDIQETVCGFKSKFQDALIVNINSTDCRNTIPVLNKCGYSVLPHHLIESYEEMKSTMNYCIENKSVLRYLDLNEVHKAIIYIHSYITQYNDIDYEQFRNSNNLFNRTFCELDDITLINIKLYYINLLRALTEKEWDEFKTYSMGNMKHVLNPSFDNGPIHNASDVKYDPILISTRDAHTLTNGPTIFLTNNAMSIANLYLKQSDIPISVISNISNKIDNNNTITLKIEKLERELVDAEKLLETPTKTSTSTNNNKSSKSNKKNDIKSDDKTILIQKEIDILNGLIKAVSLNDTFIPNKREHFKKWCSSSNMDFISSNSFSCNLDDYDVIKIMSINNIDDCLKILLIMGIGVFADNKNKLYTEIMKQLADEQKLYLIIASSDYIYGTNYQFCHGYISKDLHLSQEKIIQAIGRIGRNNNHLEYTIRFRSNDDVLKLFNYQENKPEVDNMNRLFN